MSSENWVMKSICTEGGLTKSFVRRMAALAYNILVPVIAANWSVPDKLRGWLQYVQRFLNILVLLKQVRLFLDILPHVQVFFRGSISILLVILIAQTIYI